MSSDCWTGQNVPLWALEDWAVGLSIGLLVSHEKQLFCSPHSVYFLMGEFGVESYNNMVLMPELLSAYPQGSERVHMAHG